MRLQILLAVLALDLAQLRRECIQPREDFRDIVTRYRGLSSGVADGGLNRVPGNE
jgi:hypothetical protein